MHRTDGNAESAIDWRLTTWDGARREQLRRWAALPLEHIVAALEEMQELANWLATPHSGERKHRERRPHETRTQ
jgi:hypothetical protein